MKLLFAFTSVLLVAGTARADNKDKADALFKQGKKLMGEKRYADACSSFEESNKLDPGIGTELNIAKCYEEWGKLGRAFTSYQLAEPSTTLDITMPAGLPTTVRADQMLLTSDGMMLPLDLTKPIEVDAIVDKPTNTLYELAVVQLGIDTTGTMPAITRTIVLYMYTTAEGMPLFKVPPETFTVGKTYYITVRSFQGGYTAAADGDLTVASLPLAASVLDSGVFTVGAP